MDGTVRLVRNSFSCTRAKPQELYNNMRYKTAVTMDSCATGAHHLFSMLSAKYILLYPTFIFPDCFSIFFFFFLKKKLRTLLIHVEKTFSSLKSDSKCESNTGRQNSKMAPRVLWSMRHYSLSLS